jgi:hypothetical protein
MSEELDQTVAEQRDGLSLVSSPFQPSHSRGGRSVRFAHVCTCCASKLSRVCVHLSWQARLENIIYADNEIFLLYIEILDVLTALRRQIRHTFV